MLIRLRLTSIFAAISLAGNSVVTAGQDRILVQSTTSTENSGLYTYLLPIFEAETGLRVDVVAVGTGQAIKNARNGDADVLLVHAKSAEEAFVTDGFGIKRFDLMYNDFVIIGPKDDPSHVSDAKSVNQAFALLAQGSAPFVSRGDDSGTHKKERHLWAAAILSSFASPSTTYLESGTGMGATIRIAVEQQGYTLSDRATWIAFQNKQSHKIVYSGAPELFNQYGIIAINPAKHPYVNTKGATKLINWMLGSKGQAAIAAFQVAGQQLFFPNAK